MPVGHDDEHYPLYAYILNKHLEQYVLSKEHSKHGDVQLWHVFVVESPYVPGGHAL